MLATTLNTGEYAEFPFKLTGRNGKILKKGTVTLEETAPVITPLTTVHGSQEAELTLELSKACRIRHYPGAHNDSMDVRVNGHKMPGVLCIQLLEPRQDIELVYDKEIRVYENKSVFPRAYIVYNFASFSTLEDMWKINMRTTALVDGLEREITTPDSPVQIDNSVRIRTYKPHRVVIDTETKSSGLLVLTDTYYPGWKAYVDGRNQEIHRVNGLVRGVLIEEGGKHTVEFVYRPLGLYLGGFLSISTLSIMLIITRRGKGICP